MLFFELKKLLKRKYFFIIITFSLIVSFCAHLYNQYITQPSFEEEFISGEGTAFESNPFIDLIDLNAEENSGLTEEEKIEIEQKSNSISDNMLKYFIFSEEEKPRFNKDKKTQYNNDYNNNILKYDHLIKEYNIKMSDINQKRWEWRLFAANHRLNNNTYPMDYTGMGIEFPNIIRKIIFNQPILFGLPLVFILIILFSGIVSKEKEDGTWNLLKAQPISKFKILFSKFSALLILIFIYLISTLIFISILSFCTGVGFENGLLDLYKVFDGNHLSSFKGYEIIFLNLLSFLFYFSFIILFIMFISSRFKDTKSTIAISLTVIVVLYFLTYEFGYFKSILNPISAVNFNENILGGNKSVFDSGLNKYINILVSSKGISQYFIYILLSIIFFLLMLIEFDYKKKEISTNSENIKNISPFRMELYKIIKPFDFKLYTFMTFIILVLIFVKFVIIDNEVNINKSLDSFQIEELISEKEKEIKDFINNKELYIKQYDKKYGDGEGVYQSELDSMKEYINKKIQESNFKKDERNYFINKDGKKYYETVINRYKNTFEEYSSFATKNGRYNKFTYEEGLALYNYMKEHKLEPISKLWLINQSEYEEISDQFKNLDAKKLQMANSHSSLYSIYRLFNTYRFDLIVLFLLILMVMGGFTYDIEKGNQLTLMYTEPISRTKYYLYKLCSAILVSILVLSAIFILYFALGFATEGMKTVNYPVVYYENVINNFSNISENTIKHFIIIPMYEYMLRLFSSLILQMIFVTSLGIFISIFVKSKIYVFLVTSAILIIGMFLVNYIPQGFNYIIPFNHLNATNIANGSVVFHSKMPNYSIYISIAVLIIFSILISVVGVKVVNKREVK